MIAHLRRRGLLLAFILANLAPGASSLAQEESEGPTRAEATPEQAARGLFRESCVRCHGPARSRGGLRLDELGWDPADDAALGRWLDVLERLEAGDMPPAEEPRPAPEAVDGLRLAIRAAFAELPDGVARPRALRRLNRVQYRNTLRDLLSIDVTLEDPTRDFPDDDELEGFTVLADGQGMSDFRLDEVLRAARLALDLATFDGLRPEPETHRMFDLRSEREGNFAVNHTRSGSGPAFLFMSDERIGNGPRGQFLESSERGASEPGWYEFSITLESKGRATDLPALRDEVRPGIPVYHPEDLHRLELYLAKPGRRSQFEGRRRVLVESIDLPDDEVVTLERRYWLASGWRLEAAFGNAFPPVPDRYLRALGMRAELAPVVGLQSGERYARLAELSHAAVERADAPRIVIHAASESGPYHESWPPPCQLAAYGAPGTPLVERLSAFATRAFRRPATEDILAPYLGLARGSPGGLRAALEAVLSSPRCLYLIEPEGELDDWALAARLSYFLWNTLPDEELCRLAAEGRLRDPSVLRAQACRLLADARVGEFVESFTWSWLGLQSTLDMAPDPARFPEYYGSHLDQAAAAETRALFRHVLEENRPITELLDASYAFVNADLARLYGLEGVSTTARFQRVELPARLGRGGLLGQAAVLTASANGVDTSPVKRGVWVLEHLLGTPPDPPPPGVSLPEPDARGARSVRETLRKHRSIESCNACHRSIDPLGFALEPFDAIGRWRENYESGAPIVTTERLPDGTTLMDAGELRAVLLRDPRPFARNLAQRLAACAGGHSLRPSDRFEIERILASAERAGFGLRDLLLAVVESRLFLTR